MARIAANVTELIGRTPLVRLNRVAAGLGATVLVKVESQNPVASVKDRIGLALIEAAEKAGRLILETYLSPNRTFVDLPELINEMDPLRDFSEACRRELQSSHAR